MSWRLRMSSVTPVTMAWPTSWARVLCSLAAEDACFRMWITLGVVLICSLVFHVCVPECSRNGSGVRPYLWVQEKFVYIRQSTQNAGLCLAELLGHFYSSWDIIKKSYSLEYPTSRNQYSQLIIKVILRISFFSTVISPIYTFSSAGNKILYAPSKGTK